MVALFVETVEEHCRWPKTPELSAGRRRKINGYLDQFPEQDFWRRAFAAVNTSGLLRGEVKSPGHEHFKATFDWFFQRGKQDQVENCLKAAEGKYLDDDSTASRGSAPRPGRAAPRDPRPSGGAIYDPNV